MRVLVPVPVRRRDESDVDAPRKPRVNGYRRRQFQLLRESEIRRTCAIATASCSRNLRAKNETISSRVESSPLRARFAVSAGRPPSFPSRDFLKFYLVFYLFYSNLRLVRADAVKFRRTINFRRNALHVRTYVRTYVFLYTYVARV